ncbi:MAG: DUF2281 domain-containing protein [Chloroflexi bacterium]|nr:DUF2281 domain-containing protein [Ignavibacteriales bacterium]MBI3741408.1 DUF2281 domain-containing protein [Chloroflexota bacterium]
MTQLEKTIGQLPPNMQKEVQDFAEFLLARTKQKKNNQKPKHLRMDWAGALKEYRDQFTSVELQKKSLDWWGT